MEYSIGFKVAGDNNIFLLEFKVKAEAGDADGQYSLGYVYYEGEGVEQDYKKAFEWRQKSTGQGEDQL